MTVLRPLAAALALSAATAAPALAETRTWDLAGFTEVEATAGVEVIVEVGRDFSIALEASRSADLETALVEMRGDRLVLGRRRGGNGINIGRAPVFVYTVTLPSLEAARSTAGSEMDISGIAGGAIALSAAAGSDLVARGSCDTLEADASSGADIEAFELTCRDVEADASSGADIEVMATERIRARASSGADVLVRGNPERRDTRDSSGGNVRFRD